MAKLTPAASAARAVLGEMYGCLFESQEMVLEVFSEKMKERGWGVYWIGTRSSGHLGTPGGDVITIRCYYDHSEGWSPATALLNGDDFWDGPAERVQAHLAHARAARA